MALLKHLGRTLAHMAAIAAAIALVVFITIKLGVTSFYVIFLEIAAVIAAYTIWSGRKHAYWAPVSDRINALKWKSGDGKKMETVVENAIVQFGQFGSSKNLRVSIYECGSGKRILRKMIGDDATYLGRHGIGIWFHIADKYHARRDGLVCMDVETGDWLYHVPRSEIESVRPTKKGGVFKIEDRLENEVGEINLAALEANEPRHGPARLDRKDHRN